MKRFLSLDSHVYGDGALPGGTKELLGLVASTVLRCDDCIRYHLVQCKKDGITDAQLVEALDIALIVGGSITIPNVRRALADWRTLGDGHSFLEGACPLNKDVPVPSHEQVGPHKDERER